MATGSDFFDKLGDLFVKGADAYGQIQVIKAQARANSYGGHGGGDYGTNAYGDSEYYVDAPNVNASIPAWAILAGVGALVFVLARR
jgi:hypothetical protein